LDHAEAFRRCLRIRIVEEALPKLKAAGFIQGSLHLCVGQEAVPVGVCATLCAEDRVVCTYRGHGWVIARGVPLGSFFGELMGRDSDLCGGRGGSAYLSAHAHGVLGENSIVGAGVPIAVGSALRSSRLPDGAITAAVIGDGALNQGAVHEALNFAAVLKLPLLVVVENNGYAELTPTDDMFTVTPLAKRAEAYGMPWSVVDGNDVSSVETLVRDVGSEVRGGSGPYLIEARTHRLTGHYDLDPQSYRPEGELERARDDEPLVRLSRELAPAARDAIHTEVTAEVAAAIDAAKNMPIPEPATARRHVYA
jgi:TPP-dependent pyruvate/acetoin dehydrogenase alpha subunit